MTGLSAQQLARMRRIKGQFQTDTAIIQRSTPGGDETGYYTDSFAAVGTVDCRLLPMNRQQMMQMVAAQEKGRSYYTASLPYAADIRDGDRVAVGSVTYEVVRIETDRTDKTDKQVVLAKFGNG